MNKFIYEETDISKKLPDNICRDIIEKCEQYFEENEENEEMTLDIITHSANNEFWNKIKYELTSRLIYVMKQYYSRFDEEIYHLNKLHKELIIENITLKKYLPNKGKTATKCDFKINDDKYYRILTYVFYLNDTYSAGEYIFENGIKIKPNKGAIILYPSDWMFSHREEQILSDSKYIITGWINVNI